MKVKIAIVVFIGLFVTLPLWFAMLYGILLAIDAQPWLWVIFWTYVPITFILTTLAKIVEQMDD